MFLFIYDSIFRNTTGCVWGCEFRLNFGTIAFIVLSAVIKGPFLESVLIKGGGGEL